MKIKSVLSVIISCFIVLSCLCACSFTDKPRALPAIHGAPDDQSLQGRRRERKLV